jgi:hypothetical protein
MRIGRVDPAGTVECSASMLSFPTQIDRDQKDAAHDPASRIQKMKIVLFIVCLISTAVSANQLAAESIREPLEDSAFRGKVVMSIFLWLAFLAI